MKTIGFVISNKENEKRRALLPLHIKNITNKNYVFVENNYGEVLGIPDSEYEKAGVHICSRDEALHKDVVVDPKIGDAEYLESLNNGTTLYGWVHLVQNKELTDLCIKKHFSTLCWENMFDHDLHVFYRNNQIAGEAAIFHAFQCYGKSPDGLKVAVLGNGNVASGAIKTLKGLGAFVKVFDREHEEDFKREFFKYDVLVNAILWDTNRKDHIIYNNDMKKMRNNSLLIDISCDHNGGFESSHPTTINNPMYKFNGVYHYAVDHVPSLFHRDASESISLEVSKYLDDIIEEKENPVLTGCLDIKDGQIINQKINVHQNR